MLYHLFIDQSDLLSVNNIVYKSYINAFQSCQLLYYHLKDFYIDQDKESKDISLDTKSKEGLEDNIPNTNYLLADFEAFAYYQF